jgi:hypothetical protein
MQLKIQRSQRTSITNKIIFCLDIRADYSAEEQHNIQRYRLGSQGIYNSRAAQKHFAAAEGHLDQTQTGTTGQRMGGLVKGAFSMALAHMQLNVTVGSLAKGHHIECRDLEELLEAEDALRNACKNLTRYLEVANTFDGSEVVISYENGEEKVDITEHMPPLIAQTVLAQDEGIPEPGEAIQNSGDVSGAPRETGQDFARIGAMLKRGWLAVENKIMVFASARGRQVSVLQVRIASAGVGVLILVILWNVL